MAIPDEARADVARADEARADEARAVGLLWVECPLVPP